jgi:hypothetical protein
MRAGPHGAGPRIHGGACAAGGFPAGHGPKVALSLGTVALYGHLVDPVDVVAGANKTHFV